MEDLKQAVKDKDATQVENIIENSPDPDETVVEAGLENTPLMEEATQIGDGDKRTDEVNNDAVEETLKDPTVIDGLGDEDTPIPDRLSNDEVAALLDDDPDEPTEPTVLEASPSRDERFKALLEGRGKGIKKQDDGWEHTKELILPRNEPVEAEKETGPVFKDDGGPASPYMDKVVNNEGMLGLMLGQPTLNPEGEMPFLGIEDEGGGPAFDLPKGNFSASSTATGPLTSGLGGTADIKTPEHADVKVAWDNVKSTLANMQKAGGEMLGTTTLNGVQTDHFNPEVTNPTFSKGKGIELPKAGSSTSSAPIGGQSAAGIFSGIMSGNGRSGGFGESSMGQGKGGGVMKPGRKMPKQTGGRVSQGAVQMTPLKLGNGGGSGSPKMGGMETQLLLRKVIQHIKDNHQHWKHNSNGYVFENGSISIYVDKGAITVKYGSYRRVALEQFAKKHPDELKVLAQELGV